jgi:hypothetical protein
VKIKIETIFRDYEMAAFHIDMKALFSRLAHLAHRFFISGSAAFLAIFTFALGWPHPAFAQATTLGGMMCNVFENLGPVIDLMDALAYVAGGILLGQGVLHIKAHTENPTNNPIHQSLSRIAAGAALLALPYFANVLVNTLFFQVSGGGVSSCVEGGVISIASGGGLDVLLTNFVGNIQDAMVSLLSVVAFAMGVFLIIRGLMKGAKYGTDPRSHSVPTIVTNLAIGTILIVIGQSLGSMLLTIFGSNTITSSSVVLGWTAVQNLGASTQFVNAITAALTFFQLIGMIAFIRGWYIIKSAVEGAGQATVAQGFTHIIGGVLAINIYSFLEIMDQTFGTGLLTG